MSELISLHRLLISIFTKVAPTVVDQLQDISEIALFPYSKDKTGYIEIRTKAVKVGIRIDGCSVIIEQRLSPALPSANMVRFDLNDEKSLDESQLAIAVLTIVSRGMADHIERQEREAKSRIRSRAPNENNDFFDIDKSFIYKTYNDNIINTGILKKLIK